jgi:hypothetical protein
MREDVPDPRLVVGRWEMTRARAERRGRTSAGRCLLRGGRVRRAAPEKREEGERGCACVCVRVPTAIEERGRLLSVRPGRRCRWWCRVGRPRWRADDESSRGRGRACGWDGAIVGDGGVVELGGPTPLFGAASGRRVGWGWTLTVGSVLGLGLSLASNDAVRILRSVCGGKLARVYETRRDRGAYLVIRASPRAGWCRLRRA